MKKRALPFSFWPVTRGTRRHGLYDAVFAVSPWAVMRGSINTHCSGSTRTEALAFLEQAHDFYVASKNEAVSSNPLILYYAFLNLAKAVILRLKQESTLPYAKHGLAEDPPSAANLATAVVKVIDDPNKKNVFPLLLRSLGFTPPSNGFSLKISELLPQVVVGHRLWREAGGKERFFGLSDIWVMHDPAQQIMWLDFFVERGDLNRYNRTHRSLITEGGLNGVFEQVSLPAGAPDGYLCFQQSTPLTYGDRPSDQIADLVKIARPVLWRVASSTPPYRRYYLHLTPSSETSRIPQIGSAYALFFHLGSLARYQPHVLDALLAERYGPFITEFVTAQPEQLLYLLASELCEREVAKPAVV